MEWNNFFWSNIHFNIIIFNLDEATWILSYSSKMVIVVVISEDRFPSTSGSVHMRNPLISLHGTNITFWEARTAFLSLGAESNEITFWILARCFLSSFLFFRVILTKYFSAVLESSAIVT